MKLPTQSGSLEQRMTIAKIRFHSILEKDRKVETGKKIFTRVYS